MDTVEVLRRKHIQTLEVLQELSDENESLKSTLAGKGNAQDDDENNTSSADKIDSLNNLLMDKQNEVKAASVEVTRLKATNKELKNSLKSANDSYEAERALSFRLKREIETQASLMLELRNSITAEIDDSNDDRERQEIEKNMVDLRERVERLEQEIISKNKELEDLRESQADRDKRFNAKLDSLKVMATKEKNRNETRELKLLSLVSAEKEEAERLRAQGGSLQVEIKRLSVAHGTTKKEVGSLAASLKEERRKVEELQAALDDTREYSRTKCEGCATNVSGEEERQCGDPAVAPPFADTAKSKKAGDFGTFVKLKKENYALKMQLRQLQQSIRFMGKR